MPSQCFTWTIQAREDLSHEDKRFRGISADTGTLANDATKACGILLYGAPRDKNVTLASMGISKFAAGGEISKGSSLTLTTSGYFIEATEDDNVVGRALNWAVSSGSIGIGLFHF